MSDRPSENLGGMDIDLARRIDEVCRRFEGDLREGRQPRIDDYLVDVVEESGPALRAELKALEGELPQSEEVTACGRPALTPRRDERAIHAPRRSPACRSMMRPRSTPAANVVKHVLRVGPTTPK